MNTDPAAISPALRALVDAGDGMAEIVDPETNRVFVVQERTPLEEPADIDIPPHLSIAGKSKAAIDAMIDEGLTSGVAGEIDAGFWAERHAKLDAVVRAKGDSE